MGIGPSPTRDDYNQALGDFLTAVLPPGIDISQQQNNRVPQPAGVDFVTMNEIGRRRLSTNVTTYADCAFVGTVSESTLTVTDVRLGSIEMGSRLLGEGVQDGTTIQAQPFGLPGKTGVYTLSAAQGSPISGVPLATGAALIAQPTEVTIQIDVYGPGSGENATIATTLLRDGYAALWFMREGWADRGIGVLDVGEPRQMAFIDGEQQYEDRFSFDVKLQANQVTSPSQDFADSVGLTINVPSDDGDADLPPQSGDGVPSVVSIIGGNTVPRAAAGFPGFGWANQSDAQYTQSSPMMIAAGVETQLTIDGLSSNTDVSHLRPPFLGWPFWRNNRFYPLNLFDDYELRVTFSAQSLAIGNTLKLRMDIGPPAGTFFEDRKAFDTAAGETRVFSFVIPSLRQDHLLRQRCRSCLSPQRQVTHAALESEPLSRRARDRAREGLL